MIETILLAGAVIWASSALGVPAVADAVWRDPPIDNAHPMGGG